jgi:3-hydroxyacyl-[acyl-carrier-protein] dehydratase
MGASVDIQSIMELLPHRYPFLLVDRVVEYVPDISIRAYKNVTMNEAFFQGHFPGTPIMPGVLIVEAMAQACGILYLLSNKDKVQGKLLYFLGMDKVKFRRPVVPGDRLDIEAAVLKTGSRAWTFRGEAFVDGKRVAEAEMRAGGRI